MVTPLFISMLFPVLALGVAAWFVYWIMTRDQGTSEMKKVAGAIREGAAAFMNRQYRTIGLISVVVALGLWAAYYFSAKPETGWQTALAFLFGAASSAVSGIVGMSIAVRTNSRSAFAAKRSFSEALT